MPEEPRLLSVNLATFRICGLGSGADSEEVEGRLGIPSPSGGHRDAVLSYPEIGLQIGVGASGALSGFTVVANPDASTARSGFRPFQGTWLPWGGTRPPSEAALIRALGRPSFRDCRDDEICVEWSRPAALVAADYALDASLLTIHVDFNP
ncbi:MAG TPA: hypothetical protein VFI25_14640 [Planctomycetota bacterium]|jgi:hypothetical protein|nr:hypothetical protein [Planctomycetota bacterium]